ncbi:hypothetical protein V5799_017314, partial [Amblyomma americanum]
MTNADVKTVISIIDALTSGQEQDARARAETGSSFGLLLQQRLSCFAEKASANGDLRRIISESAPHLLQPQSSDDWHWLFLDHCISLLIVLKDLLDTSPIAAVPSKPQGPSHHSEAPPAPPNCLGVLQKKTVQGLLQFVVALGINPNLLPGVGLPLEQRTVSSLPNCSACLLPWQKHRYLVASVRALLMCIQSPVLCGMVLHHHLVDVLAALLQLCHAPIRKITDESENTKSNLSFASHSSTVLELKSSLAKCRASAPADDASLIQEMLEDRQYLSLDLQRVLETTYQPIIVRELLLLLSSASQLKAKGVAGVKRTPQWLKDICGQLLTQCLLRKGGLAQVILGTFDAWSVDSSGGVVSEQDWQKCEAFAKLVARIPSTKGVTVEGYYEGIAPQVVELFLQPQGSSMNKVAFRVACAIVGAMLEEQAQQTSRLVLSKIFSPLFSCIHQQGTSLSANGVVVSEEDLGNCIEVTHKMVSSIDPSHPVLTALVPLFPVLFEITISTENTVSYLRKPCEEILSAVYHSQPAGSAIELLHWCLFKTDCYIPLATPRDDITFVLGSCGGIEAVRRSLPLSDEEWLTRSDQAFLATASVFHHGNLKEPCTRFFVSLLKKLTRAVGELVSKESTGTVLQPTSASELSSQEVKDNLLLLHLVESFADLISETLLQNKVALLEFVVETLNRVSQLSETLEGSSLALQSTLFCLTLLGLLISGEDIAAAKNEELWQQCNQCLMTLAARHSNPEIKNMAHHLQISFASQGVVATPQMSRSTSIASGRAPPRADSGEMAHQKKLAAIAAGFNILSVSNCHGTRPLQTLEQQQEVESTQVAAESSGVPPSPGCTTFEQLWCELHDTMVPIRGHAFIQLRRMLLEGRAEVWQHRDQLLEACHSAIQDEDSYVYLSAIQALAVLVDRDSDHLLPWLAEQLSLEKLSVEARLNLGEVLLRVTKNFGEWFCIEPCILLTSKNIPANTQRTVLQN